MRNGADIRAPEFAPFEIVAINASRSEMGDYALAVGNG
jgi:hypothetical protein